MNSISLLGLEMVNISAVLRNILKVVLLGGTVFFVACDDGAKPIDTVTCSILPVKDVAWRLESANAPWKARDSAAEFVLNSRMWLKGGWFDSFQNAPRDVWSSADGKNWELATEQADWTAGDLSASVTFNEQAWLLGGWEGGWLAGARASNEVWRSSDGQTWERVVLAPWSARLGASAVVFKGRLWVLGGVEDYYNGNANSLKNDIWSSPDGVSWERHLEHAPWSARAFHGAFVFQDRIWVVGGGNYTPEYFALNDVWNSVDGIHWERVTASAPWSPRIWFSTAVYRGAIWILGGWTGNPYKNLGDVWYSVDGLHWVRWEATTWTPRHEHSTYVLDDKLWVVGGLADGSGLTNEVWSLGLLKTGDRLVGRLH
jgi:hypothetical protein